MTDTDTLTAGRELDCRVAKALGIDIEMRKRMSLHGLFFGSKPPPDFIPIPFYSTDMSAAMEALMTLRQRFRKTHEVQVWLERDAITVEFRDFADGKLLASCEHADLCLAICGAILRAKEGTQ